MLPFLASPVIVHNADGTTVTVDSAKPTGSDDEDHADTTAHAVTPSKHSKHSSSGDTGIEVVPIVAIVFVFLWLIVKALMAPFTQRAARSGQTPSGGSTGLSDEEQAVLLKLQRTLADMENRIESLETILIEEHRTKENYGNKI